MKLGSVTVLTLSWVFAFSSLAGSRCVSCFCQRREPMREMDESNGICACA